MLVDKLYLQSTIKILILTFRKIYIHETQKWCITQQMDGKIIILATGFYSI